MDSWIRGDASSRAAKGSRDITSVRVRLTFTRSQEVPALPCAPPCCPCVFRSAKREAEGRINNRPIIRCGFPRTRGTGRTVVIKAACHEPRSKGADAMSDPTGDHVDALDEEPDVESSYKPPPEKSIEQILEADKEDESLRKYKETLLGEAKSGGIVVDPNDSRKVIVKKLALCVADRPDMELDLTGDLSQLKKQTFIIKEGVSYRIRIDFIVQREIVHGLKYVQKTYRLGVPVDKMTHMVGSYPPKTELQSYTTPAEDAPAGVVARGSYSVSSLFTDDDKHEHLKWEWSFEIKKDWKE